MKPRAGHEADTGQRVANKARTRLAILSCAGRVIPQHTLTHTQRAADGGEEQGKERGGTTHNGVGHVALSKQKKTKPLELEALNPKSVLKRQTANPKPCYRTLNPQPLTLNPTI
jgi:hypothetical protein